MSDIKRSRKCPKCGSLKSRVYGSRTYFGDVIRRRQCTECGRRWSTIEIDFWSNKEYIDDMNKIKVIIRHPGEKDGRVVSIGNTLEKFQEIVGGRIEVADIGVPGVRLICNESGKIDGLPENFRIPGDIIHGSAIIVGVDGEEFVETPMTLRQWRDLLQQWGNDTGGGSDGQA